MKKTMIIPVLTAAAVVGLSACSATTGDAMAPADASPATTMSASPSPASMMTKPSESAMDSMSGAGAYISYEEYTSAMAKYDDSAVVLFFHAAWCPTCKAVDAAVKSDVSLIPKGVTLVKVDYDSATQLRKKYGVTMQHTFVKVDSSGKELQKWSGLSANDLNQLAES